MDFLKSVLRGFVFPALAAAFLFPRPASAQLSPGKLAEGHAKLEGLDNCAKCHSGNVRSGADPLLCRGCHEAIDVRMKAGKGMHGLKDKDFNQCGKCHSDHLGRNFDLVKWKTVAETREKFNHDLTGYPLEGAHAKAKCADCHQPKNIKDPLILKERIEFKKKTFLGLGTECLACHKDTHGKMFARKKCLDCHGMEKWKPAEGFDHDKDTPFDLRGKHVGLECVKCHTQGQPWELPPQRRLKDNGCITCHKDVHKGKFGRDCSKCHQESGFKKIKVDGFNHDKTKFPLLGKHAEVECNQCHKGGGSWVLTRFQRCNDCHANFHKGEFSKTQRPEKCEACHTVEGFVPANFGVKEHQQQTGFPLKDAHLAIPCAACHTASLGAKGEVVKRKFKFPSMDCIACHSDPHQGQVDKYKTAAGCLSCHSGASWSEVKFDHSLTGYPLTGRHAGVECKACHTASFPFRTGSGNRLVIPDFAKRKTQCSECHKDKHQGQFREAPAKEGQPVVKCDRCHTTTDWYAEKFDHDTQSRFKLEGAHERARCDACHPTQVGSAGKFVRYKPLKSECRACHGDTVRVK